LADIRRVVGRCDDALHDQAWRYSHIAEVRGSATRKALLSAGEGAACDSSAPQCSGCWRLDLPRQRDAMLTDALHRVRGRRFSTAIERGGSRAGDRLPGGGSGCSSAEFPGPRHQLPADQVGSATHASGLECADWRIGADSSDELPVAHPPNGGVASGATGQAGLSAARQCRNDRPMKVKGPRATFSGVQSGSRRASARLV